jgi:hypothetical protein
MKFINKISIIVGDKVLRVFTSSRNNPFLYHYNTNTWELPKGDNGENLTNAVLKFCHASSMEEVVKEYKHKYYLDLYKSQVTNIESKKALSVFTNAENIDYEITDTFLEPLKETIIALKQFMNTTDLEREMDRAIDSLYAIGGTELVEAAITEYTAGVIDYEELNKSFYKFIDFIKKTDNKTAVKLEKQMDIIYNRINK